MGSEQFPLRRSGIYRNLPSFDPSLTGLKAIVVGATGISGFNTLRSLLDTPHRWRVVYALSRNPPSKEMMSLLSPEQQSRVKHVRLDLTGTAKDTAATLTKAGISADYVFFYGYIHPKGKSAMDPAMADALVEANVPIFQHFLDALGLANISPKRILLQTGGKNYGGHIGRARIPFVESDPQPKHLTNNFYYPQEEALFEYCKQNPGTDWNVVRPFGIIGVAANAGMNIFLPYAIMAAVQSEKGESLIFGGDFDEWQYELCHSSARLTGFLSEWAVLEDACKNQAFNAQDGNPLSWDRFYEELARWYGVEAGVRVPEEDESKYKVIKLAGGKDSPLGYGPPATIRLAQTLKDWSENETNAATWKKMMESSDGQIRVNPFEVGLDTFMADFAVYRIGQPSVAKLRRFGFNGFVDTIESVFEMYQESAKLGLIPLPQVKAARPTI